MAERQLNEQWVEKGSDGKMHMYKAVEGPCERCDISHSCNLSVDCHMERGLIAKDLGILNEEGCLPSSWGGYPEVIRVGKPNFVTYFRVSLVVKDSDGSGIQVHVTGNTRQEAIDAWNRRA